MDEMEGVDYLLEISKIIEYVGTSIRPIVEGERVCKANHIVFCGFVSRNSNKMDLLALCLQSSALQAMPHEIKITINTGAIECMCSCVAGKLGRCKHSVAVLIYLSRYV